MSDYGTVSATCPRCGYDQRGVTAQWTDSCDLFSTCSECGLQIDWAEVFHPEKFQPIWCVEYARPGLRWINSIPTTLFRSFAPWWFFRLLRMSHHVKWRRLLGYMFVLLFVLAILGVAEQAFVATRVWFQVRAEYQDGLKQVNTAIATLSGSLANTNQISETDRFWMQSELDSYNAWIATNPRLNHSYSAAVFEAILMPRSGVSNGWYDLPSRVVPYPSPAQLHHRIIPYYSSPFRRPILQQIAYSNGRWLLAGIAAFIGIPAAFVLLPVSRRIQNVRGAHIVRLWLYSVFVPVAIALVALLSVQIMYAWNPAKAVCGSILLFSTAWPMLVALILWWSYAIRIYLQMPHSWAIAPLFAVLSALVAGVVLFLFVPHWIVVV